MVTRRFAWILVAGLPLPALLPAPWIGLLIVLGFAIAVAVLDVAVAGPLRAVRLSRDGDRTVWLGNSATVTLTVANTARRPVRLHLRDSWEPSAGAWPAFHDVLVPGGEKRELITKLDPVRHGDRPAVRVVLRSLGPFGVAYRQSRSSSGAEAPPWTLRVLPHFPSRRILPEKLARMRVIEGSSVTRGRGHGTEFDVLREYVIGDDVRSIDWRASARHNDVMVRTWRPERDRRIVCVIDTGRTSAARVGDVPRLDAAIDAALLLSVLASHADDRVDLLALDAVVRARVAGSRVDRLIDAMASLTPVATETDWSLLATALLRRDQKRSLLVIFTALEPAPIVEGLLPLLPRLAARHQVLVAGVRDPLVAQLAELGPHPAAADVHRAAAAQRVLTERDRVRSVLAHFGAIVVDAETGSFAGEVADVYLLLKATGRL